MDDVAEIHNLLGLAATVAASASSGLLDRLTRDRDTAEGHARALGLDSRATTCLLDVLVAFGLGSRHGDDYTASAGLQKFVEQTPLAFEQTTALWAHTPEFLKTGQPFHEDQQPAQREAVYSNVVAGIGRLFAAPAQQLASQIETPPARVLDIGCGSGVWGLAIAERFAEARVTGLDLPDVLRVFQARATDLGLGERIETIAGDMHAVDIPSRSFDLVIIANVVRLDDPQRAARLVARAADAVAPGGELVVVDALGNGTPERDRALAIYALHLAMRTARGRVYARSELAQWLTDAGLGELRDLPISDALGTVGAIRARRSR